jgi:hypothetical protein
MTLIKAVMIEGFVMARRFPSWLTLIPSASPGPV